MVTITVESASYLNDYGYAVYCLCITSPDASNVHQAKRYSALRAHHMVCAPEAEFPAAGMLSSFKRSDSHFIEKRRLSLVSYFDSLSPSQTRAWAKSLYNGDAGAAAALPAGGSLPDGTFDSLYAGISVPEVSLTDYVLRRVEEAPAGHAAIIDGPSGRTIMYDELQTKIRVCAVGLAARGFEAGHVLAILAPNIPEYAIAFHAVASLGGIITTLNPLYTASEICHQLQDANASVRRGLRRGMRRGMHRGMRRGMRRCSRCCACALVRGACRHAVRVCTAWITDLGCSVSRAELLTLLNAGTAHREHVL